MGEFQYSMIKLTIFFVTLLQTAMGMMLLPIPQNLFWYAGQTLTVTAYNNSNGDGTYYNIYLVSRYESRTLVYSQAPYGQAVDIKVPSQFAKPGRAALVVIGEKGSSNHIRGQIVSEHTWYMMFGKGTCRACGTAGGAVDDGVNRFEPDATDFVACPSRCPVYRRTSSYGCNSCQRPSSGCASCASCAA